MIVLDTHVAVWITTDRSQLSDKAAAALRQAGRENRQLAISTATLWEIAVTTAKGTMRISRPLPEYLRYLEEAFVVLPLTSAIALQALSFERMPRDPNDRIIAATALVHGATLITADRKILESGEVNCVW
jgi:PIN domain nuclease of toxin-antitoxin system